MSEIYSLEPLNSSRLSFYGKAKVILHDNGDKTLLSYETPIITKKANGKLIRHYEGFTCTTGRHIKEFCGLTKKEFLNVRYELYCEYN